MGRLFCGYIQAVPKKPLTWWVHSVRPRAVNSLTYIPERKILASGGLDGKIILWDMSGPRLESHWGRFPFARLPLARIIVRS